MDLAVHDSSFVRQTLAVRPAGLLCGAKVLLGGVVVKPVKREYLLLDDLGHQVSMRLKTNIADPIPLVILRGQPIRLARAFAWHEYAWIGIPILLLFVGGALGGAIGGLATYTNSHILRSGRSRASRYALTGLVTLSSVVVFFVVAIALQSVIGQRT